MGFRYRRSYKILPGVRVNVGKKSTSVTFGGKIFRTTINKTRGTVTRSVSTPIKGLTYTETQRIAKRAPKSRRQVAKQPVEYSPTTYRVCAKLMFGIAVVAAILAVSCLAVSLFGFAVGMVAFSALSFFLWKSWRDKADQLSGTKNTGQPEPQDTPDFQKEMQALLKSAQEDAALLNNTTDPSEFFAGYDRLLERTRVLAQAEGRVSFSGRSPRSMLEELSDPEKRAAVTSDFLDRCFASGRWNAQSQAMEELRPYWQKFPESCREKLRALPELSPEEYQEANRRCIEAFEEAHDLKTVQGIRAITIEDAKEWEQRAAGVPSLPEQILSKTATKYKKDGNMELAIECLRKANELYSASEMMYDEKTHMRLVRYLQAAGRFDEARGEERKIKERFEPEQDEEERRKEFLAMVQAEAREAGTDLVEASWIGACCETCGKYRGRVFSVSGQSKEYPKLPDDFCEDCGLTLSPFWEGLSEPAYYSLRRLRELNLMPMRDTRTSEESALYEKKMADFAAEEKDREDYVWLQEHLPEMAPKSFGGYRRMKNSNSSNYQKLVCAAQEQGRTLG